MSWFDGVAERQFTVGSMVIAAMVTTYLLFAARRAWHKTRTRRARRRPIPDTPMYSGAALVTGPYAAALAVGSLRAVGVAEAVDRLDYAKSRKAVRELRAEDPEDQDRARAAVPRALRVLLGEQPGSGLALVEEALRQRERVGAELWPHALEEFAVTRCLPYDERETLQSLAVDIGRAEERLRVDGVLGTDEWVPSLLACHWAEGVHLTRCALRVDWLPRPQGMEYLARAAELATRWYPTYSTLLAAQLMPALLSDDVYELAWRLPAARRLLADGRFPAGEVASPHGG